MQLTYFGMLGHESCELIQYLEEVEGVAPIRRGHNPATWMLEVTGGAMSNTIKASHQDFPTVYKVRKCYEYPKVGGVEVYLQSGVNYKTT